MTEDPPAFPTTKPLDGWGDPNAGMTLHQWYAGQALAGLCTYATPSLDTAIKACEYADAMMAVLAERAKQEIRP